jgi:hypothetical protein
MLFAPPPAPAPAGLLAVAAEPSDIVHRSSNPPPPPLDFLDAAVEDVALADMGGVMADRADDRLIAGIAAYAGAVAGVELGRT